MADQLEAAVVEKMFDIAARSGDEIIDTKDLRTASDQAFAQM
jgi:hypothetical protein